MLEHRETSSLAGHSNAHDDCAQPLIATADAETTAAQQMPRASWGRQGAGSWTSTGRPASAFCPIFPVLPQTNLIDSLINGVFKKESHELKKLWLLITDDSHLGVRLGLSFGVLIFILLSVGWVGVRQLQRVDADLAKMVDQRWRKVQLSRQAQALSNLNSRITLQSFFADETEIGALMTERANNSQKISELIETLKNESESPEEAELLNAIEQKRSPYTNSYKIAIRLLTEQEPAAARAQMLHEALPRLIAYHEAWNAYVDYQGHQMDLAQDSDAASGAAARKTTFWLIALAVFCAVAIAAFVTRNITCTWIKWLTTSNIWMRPSPRAITGWLN
jgi:hypothetical protein